MMRIIKSITNGFMEVAVNYRDQPRNTIFGTREGVAFSPSVQKRDGDQWFKGL